MGRTAGRTTSRSTRARLTKVSASFTGENFGSLPPVWTIGTADRSSHEFLHGQITNPIDLDPNYTDQYTARLGNSVQDDREYWGNWNYWADFAANRERWFTTQLRSVLSRPPTI